MCDRMTLCNALLLKDYKQVHVAHVHVAMELVSLHFSFRLLSLWYH